MYHICYTKPNPIKGMKEKKTTKSNFKTNHLSNCYEKYGNVSEFKFKVLLSTPHFFGHNERGTEKQDANRCRIEFNYTIK